MKTQIISLIRELGPIVPNEITRKLGKASVIVSALLSELVKEGEVFLSSKKIGSSPLYYLKGQEESMRKRLLPELKIPEKKTIEFFEKNKLVLKDNLSPQQRFIIDGLKDYITKINLNINGKERIFYKHYSISSDVIYNELNSFNVNKKPKKKKVVKKTVDAQKSLFGGRVAQKRKMPTSTKVVETNVYEKVDDISDLFFTKYNMTVIESKTVRKNREYIFVARANYRIPQIYFIKYLKKKSINDNDISKAHVAANVKKMPCIIMTQGKLTKKARELLEKLGPILNVIKM